MSSIEHIVGREVLDSRGNPTVEVEVVPRVGRRGAGHRPVGRVDRRSSRRSSCATAATATAARACVDAVDHVNGEIADALRRASTPSTSACIDTHADRPRRHRQQGPARRQRHPRRVARGGQGRGRRARPAALPLRRRRQRPRAAGADDERAQRRRARRQQRRPPGVHDHAGRRGELLARRCAGAPRPTTRSRRCCTSAACRPRSATRAASRPNLASNEEAARAADRGDRAGRLHAGRRHRARARRRRPPSSTRTARYVLAGEGRDAVAPAEMVGLLGRPVRQVPDRVDRGRHGRGGLGRLDARSPTRSATGCSSSATTCSSPTPSASAAASTPAWPTRSWSRSTRSAR